MPIDAATLRLRYPAFAAVGESTVDYWLTDAARIVTADWGEDQEPATLALAAHSMAITPGVMSVADDEALPAGVTSFRSASFSVSMSEAAVSAQVAGGYGATPYGREFAPMLRRNTGGPALIGWAEPATCGAWFP